MYKLIVKDFGVLKDIDIVLNKTNLFIGDNGSGKSVLAKLITIVTSFDEYSDELLEQFKRFDIDFVEDDTVIEFIDTSDDEIILSIINKKVKFAQKAIDSMKMMQEKKDTLDFFHNPNNLDTNSLLPKFFASKYIPADRNLISLFNNFISNLITSNIPLPKTLLEFSAQYNSARNEIKELELLNMKFVSQNGKDKIYYDQDNYLPLENSSSGMQTALPLYLTIKYFNQKKYHSILVEEPEQNLYPKSQIETIKFIIENCDNNIFLMTHSPYVLSILNILIFAYKASNTNETLKDKITKIIPISQQIDPDKFTAYLIEDGKSINIKSKRGLISENSIDEISDIIDDEFSRLMNIYREFKDDK
jgi:predicted ATPase